MGTHHPSNEGKRSSLDLLVDVTTIVALATAIAVLGAALGVAFVLWAVQTFM